ncbi:MAG: Phosphoenolpyruvate-protein phosphotransferase [Pseudomonadota bacterium]
MTFTVHGQAVSRGVAIGRAVIVTSSRVDVAHYFIQPEQTAREIERLCQARQVVVQDIERTQVQVQAMSAGSAPPELMALLDVHLMLLQDEQLDQNVRQWIDERHYNAEWALTAQLEVVARQFEEMDDPYLRERKADVEQVVERMLRVLQGDDSPVIPPVLDSEGKAVAHREDPLVLVAHDLSPADMLQFKQSVFAGFVTDVGGKTSHTAIVARSMDIPAVVGARTASQWIHQDDWVIIDGDAGVVVVNPSPAILDEYAIKQRAGERERERLARLKNTPAVTSDGQRIELLANIEQPSDAAAALKAGAVGVGLFRTEFLFMGRNGQLPDEEEQYRAYVATVEGMQGLPVTIRTIDVGADKPLDRVAARNGEEHLNPALGLRAIRWCLSEPAMFLIQLRALLRAAAHGQVHVLVPMLAHASEIHQTLALLRRARDELDAQGVVYGPIKLGAMIEVPAAALTVPLFLKHFDFLSIGTNDLIQYTLAIDRADESVAHLYDPLHPAVLRLLADVIAQGHAQGKVVSVCGEMAGDVAMTRLLLGLGLRSFSMHPAQILAVKQQILRSDAQRLSVWAQSVLEADDPASLVND